MHVMCRDKRMSIVASSYVEVAARPREGEKKNRMKKKAAWIRIGRHYHVFGIRRSEIWREGELLAAFDWTDATICKRQGLLRYLVWVLIWGHVTYLHIHIH